MSRNVGIVAAAATVALIAGFGFDPANAQGTVAARQGQASSLGVQRPSLAPGSQALSALNLKLDALRQSVGRQVVVLHFAPTPLNSWEEAANNFPANNQRAEAKCKAALGDRYGRVLSREVQVHEGRWYFPNLVCETAP